MRIERTMAFWACGLLASAVIGAALGAGMDITEFDFARRFWGAAAGVLAFCSVNLWSAIHLR